MKFLQYIVILKRIKILYFIISLYSLLPTYLNAQPAKFDNNTKVIDFSILEQETDSVANATTIHQDSPKATTTPSNTTYSIDISDPNKIYMSLSEFQEQKTMETIQSYKEEQQPYEWDIKNIDYLKINKIIKNSETPSRIFKETEVPTYDNETYKRRLETLPTIIPMDYNEMVQFFIDMYTTKKRPQVTQMLTKSDLYFPIFTEVLSRYNLPLELKFLPVALSALIPHAKSQETGTAGLWQLKYATASLYGLEANSFVDERYDPQLATEVAAQHLQNLYRRYGSWHLAIAAFCSGEATINTAIRMANGSKNYWEITQYMPPEQIGYVPLFIAAAYIMNFYYEHNIEKIAPSYTFLYTDVVRVNRALDLKNVCEYINIPIEEVLLLNPALKQNAIPLMEGGYPLKLPLSKINLLNVYLQNLTGKEIILNNTNLKVQLPPDHILDKPIDLKGFVLEKPLKIEGNGIIKHTVKQGENAITIARKYDVKVRDLEEWNNLKPNQTIKPAQKLKILVPLDYISLYQNIALNEDPNAQKLPKEKTMQEIDQEINEKNKHIEISTAKKQTNKPCEHTYTVKQGDTISSIAKKFNLKTNSVKTYNGLKNDVINVGQKLTLPCN